MSYKTFIASVELLDDGGYISIKDTNKNLNSILMFYITITEKGYSYFHNKNTVQSQYEKSLKIEKSHLTIDRISLALSFGAIIISIITLIQNYF